MAIIRSGAAEFIEEVTPGTMPTNPAMQWIGVVTKFTNPIKKEFAEYQGLKEYGATNKLEIDGAVAVGETYESSFEYQPQKVNASPAYGPFDFFKYAFMADPPGTSPGALSDTLKSMSIGRMHSGKFEQLLGCYIDKIGMSCERNGIWNTAGSLKIMDVPRTTYDPWPVSDYKGSGSHATKVSSLPVTWNDITTLTYGGSNFIADVQKMSFEISNGLEISYDMSATTASKIASITPTKRDMSVTFDVNYKDINSIVKKVLEFGAADIVLVLETGTSDYTLTFKNARIPEENSEFAPEGLMTGSVKFVGINDFTLAWT